MEIAGTFISEVTSSRHSECSRLFITPFKGVEGDGCKLKIRLSASLSLIAACCAGTGRCEEGRAM